MREQQVNQRARLDAPLGRQRRPNSHRFVAVSRFERSVCAFVAFRLGLTNGMLKEARERQLILNHLKASTKGNIGRKNHSMYLVL